MKTLTSLLFCLVLNFISSSLLNLKDNEDCNQNFEEFKVKFNKSYSSEKEEMRRKKTFCKNLKKVISHQENKRFSYTKEINKYSDKSIFEMKKVSLTSLNNSFSSNNDAQFVSFSFFESFRLSEKSIPKAENDGLNWTEYTTPVRNQRDECGSCYAFGTAELVETVFQITSENKHPSSDFWVSPQEIVDCSSFYGNFGCSGGNPISSLKFLQENGAVFEKNYPYIDSQQRCYLFKEEPVFYVDKFFQVEPQNQHLLEKAVEKTPLVVALNMDKLFDYSSGVFDDWSCDHKDLDHVALLVGYGFDQNLKKHYWLLKNSYGEDWGENGFFRIERKLNSDSIGICGVTERSLLATIKLN